MKIGAVIAEYNPFHNGHQYQLETFRRQSDLDYIIVCMSGNFTQRGEPAWMPKHLRARMALLGGADLVIELPVYFATGSASIFAEGGIAHLDALGCVEELCFGCETDRPLGEHMKLLHSAADLFVSEPDEFKQLLSLGLKQGLSFPAARSRALEKLLDTCNILNQPNNILALEYLTVLKKTGSGIRPFAIKRLGQGYHSTEDSDTFASATALRQKMTLSGLSGDIPGISSESLHIIQENYGTCLPAQLSDFSSIFAALFMKNQEHLTDYTDINEDIANLMKKSFDRYTNLPDFLLSVKNKAFTYSRLCRCAAHLMTDQQRLLLDRSRKDGCAFYARILGFRKEAAPLLNQIKQSSKIPMIGKMSSCFDLLEGIGLEMMRADLLASDIYRTALQIKFGHPLKNDFRQPIVII